MRPRHPVVAAALAFGAACALAAPALAAWSASGSGAADGAASTMPGGSTPAVSPSGSAVTVRWPAATFPNGAQVEGYVVHRYDTASGLEATVGSSCSGVVATTICTETGVPSGSWVYTDTPVQGGWTGAQSPPSPVATVS